MATIKSSLMMYDGFTGPLKSIATALNITLNAFESVESASARAIDTTSIATARDELAKASVALDTIEDSVKRAAEGQTKFNNEIRDGGVAARGLESTFRRVVGILGATIGVKKIMGLSDELTQTSARIGRMNDRLQTTQELQDMIFQSAQRSRGAYQDTAAFVARLGNTAGKAFSSSGEIVAFAEQINKQLALSGASANEARGATLQLAQALGSGVLRGDELNSVFEQAPSIVQSIADYIDVDIGKIRELASEGVITADIVRNAILSTAHETNAAFESMPMTMGQIATSMGNRLVKGFEPALVKINQLANTEKFTTTADAIVNGLIGLADAAVTTLDVFSSVASFVIDNWSLIAPVVLTATGIMAGYTLATKAAAFADGALTLAKIAAIPIYAAYRGVQMQTVAAQWGLNAAMYACPLFWIIVGIGLVIGALYLGVAAFNKLAGTSYSATGLIVGAVFWAGGLVYNAFLSVLEIGLLVPEMIANALVSFANFFANVLNNPVSSVIYLITDMADQILRIFENIARAMDHLFGSNFAGAVSGFRTGLRGKVDEFVQKVAPNEDYHKVFDEVDLGAATFGLERIKLGNAFSKGYDFGAGIKAPTLPGSETTELPDYTDTWDAIALNGADTAGNTAKMANTMDLAEEDLKYIRDLAEVEAVNRFTTAEIKIEMTNHNNVNSELDLDGVVDYLAEKVEEATGIAAEGVHV